MRRPALTIEQILNWIDRFHAVTNRWPRRLDGRIADSQGETWQAIEMALKTGGRGLSIRTTLAQFLQEHRGVRNRNRLPLLSVNLILSWADDHHENTGEWPNSNSGNVLAATNECWLSIDRSLRMGSRGLSVGPSLAGLLFVHRQIRRHPFLPKLTEKGILQWAKAYFRRHGNWPTRQSGTIPDASGETWAQVNCALIQGNRGLNSGSSLARLMASHGFYRNNKGLPELQTLLIVKWANIYIEQTGQWPTHLSGPIPGSNGETWSSVHSALSRGGRGFPGNSSLFQLLSRYCRVPGLINHNYRENKRFIAMFRLNRQSNLLTQQL